MVLERRPSASKALVAAAVCMMFVAVACKDDASGDHPEPREPTYTSVMQLAFPISKADLSCDRLTLQTVGRGYEQAGCHLDDGSYLVLNVFTKGDTFVPHPHFDGVFGPDWAVATPCTKVSTSIRQVVGGSINCGGFSDCSICPDRPGVSARRGQ